ncbi:hypothetical protein BKA93DRAFT_180252 [Sparassis latifolia]
MIYCCLVGKCSNLPILCLSILSCARYYHASYIVTELTNMFTMGLPQGKCREVFDKSYYHSSHVTLRFPSGSSTHSLNDSLVSPCTYLVCSGDYVLVCVYGRETIRQFDDSPYRSMFHTAEPTCLKQPLKSLCSRHSGTYVLTRYVRCVASRRR